MIQLFKPDIANIPSIISLAHRTWKATYSSIISQEQIDYMLNTFYSEELILAQLQDDAHYFLVAKEQDDLIGYSHCLIQPDKLKLSKLYIDPDAQGKGIGKLLMSEIETYCLQKNISEIELNVNRHNPAQEFYKRVGFEITESVDIPLDKFWLNDYVMLKKVER